MTTGQSYIIERVEKRAGERIGGFMATAARLTVSVDEYLQSSYETDCDLVDGELQERHLGEFEHALLTMAIGIWFGQHRSEWRLLSLADVRIQVKQDRYRVADVAVVSEMETYGRILTAPPLIVIEILSPEDRISRYRERLTDYREMGVKNLWVLDPSQREAHDCSSGAWMPASRLEVPGTSIYLALDELPLPRIER